MAGLITAFSGGAVLAEETGDAAAEALAAGEGDVAAAGFEVVLSDGVVASSAANNAHGINITAARKNSASLFISPL
jgi:hypothetical protein